MVAATGCNTVYTSTYPYNPYVIPWTNSLFENAPAVAMGVRARWDAQGWQRKRLWIVGGDGAMNDIGFQSLSRMLASGSPTIVKLGNPKETSTSTWTGHASTPKTAAVRRQASTPGPLQAAGQRKNGSYERVSEDARRSFANRGIGRRISPSESCDVFDERRVTRRCDRRARPTRPDESRRRCDCRESCSRSAGKQRSS